MKKFIAALSILLVSTCVLAQEVKNNSIKDEDGDAPVLDAAYSLYGIAYSVSGVQSDYVYDVAHIRLHPGIKLSAGNVRGVFMFGIDQDFGRNGSSVTDSGVDPGTGNFVVGVKRAYLEIFNMFLPGLTAAAGLDRYRFPLVADNDFALFRVSRYFDPVKITFNYIKINEYSQVEKDAANIEDHRDVDALAAEIHFKSGIFSLRPGFIFIIGGEQSATASDARIMNFSLGLAADLNSVYLSLNGSYMAGRTDSQTTASAFAIDAEAGVTLYGKVRTGGFCTYGSGDDGTGTDDNSYFYNMNNLFGSTSKKTGAPDGRLLLLENATVAESTATGNVFDVMDDSRGYMSAGLFIEAAFAKVKLSALCGVAYFATADGAGNSFIGSELDLGASYTVAYNTELFVEAALLFAADSAVGPAASYEPGNVAQITLGITTDL